MGLDGWILYYCVAGELAEGKISLVDFLKGSSAMKNAFGYADTEPREGFTASLDSPRSAVRTHARTHCDNMVL